MPEIKPSEVYTTEEMGRLLKVSNSTMKRLIKKGFIKVNKIGNQYRFLGHEVLRLLSPNVDIKVSNAYGGIKQS